MNSSRSQFSTLAIALLVATTLGLMACGNSEKTEKSETPETAITAPKDSTVTKTDTSHQDLEDLEHLHEAASAVGK